MPSRGYNERKVRGDEIERFLIGNGREKVAGAEIQIEGTSGASSGRQGSQCPGGVVDTEDRVRTDLMGPVGIMRDEQVVQRVDPDEWRHSISGDADEPGRSQGIENLWVDVAGLSRAPALQHRLEGRGLTVHEPRGPQRLPDASRPDAGALQRRCPQELGSTGLDVATELERQLLERKVDLDEGIASQLFEHGLDLVHGIRDLHERHVELLECTPTGIWRAVENIETKWARWRSVMPR